MSDALKSFDRVAHVYDETRGMPPDVEIAVAGAMAAVLRPLGAPPRLLEVGVGTGRIAVPLAERGVRVAGIDIAPQMLARLREKRTDIDVLLAEASRPPFRAAAFDGALFVHILHLVPDAGATLRAVLPLIRPGGVLLRGQEERDRSSLDEALGDIQQDIVRELCGIELAGRERHERGTAVFMRIAGGAAASVDITTVARWSRPLTAREVMTRFARRDFSGAWDIPESAVPALVARMTPAVEALFGGPDRPRDAERRFDLCVARLP